MDFLIISLSGCIQKALMTVEMVQMSKIVAFHVRSLTSNADQADGVFYLAGAAMVRLKIFSLN